MSRRRCFVLVSVLVIVGSALLVATGLIFMAQAEAASFAGARDAVQARALLWSGAQVVMVKLDEQRDRILDGERPQLDRQYVIYETPTRQGVVRLLPVTARGEHVGPEAARLDLNTVSAESLTATGGVDSELAAAIVRHRETLGRPFQSVAELLEVPGVTPETLQGPIEELTFTDDALLEEGDITERVAARLADEPRGLGDLVTVYGFEPALQRNGKLRINLNVPWSDELGRRVDERFGAGSSELLKQIFDSGTRFTEEAKVFEVLRSFDVPPEDWPDIIDAITTESGEHHFGRLDINTASYEALRGLPGLEPEQATRMVQVRDRLSADEKATIAWPAIEKIIEPEQYDRLAGRMTCRSWTYRVRVAAGEVAADASDGPLGNPLIGELVIDLSAPQARIAYLRDVTLMQTAALIAVNAARDAGEDRLDDDRGEPPPPPPEPDRENGATDRSDPSFEDGAGSADPASLTGSSPAPGSSAPGERRRIGRWRAG